MKVSKTTRKRTHQNTGLLKMVSSKKTITQQMKTTSVAACKPIQNITKLQTNAGFPVSGYAGEQFMISTRANEALFAKMKHRQYKQTLQRKEIINPDRNLQGGMRRCACLVCRRKFFELSKEQQRRKAVQMRMTNEAGFLRQQQMMKYQFQQAHVCLPATQNKGNHCEPDRKRARLSTAEQNFQLQQPLSASATKVQTALVNNFHQQSVKFQPNYISYQQIDNLKKQTNWPIVNMQQNYAQLPNVENNVDFHNRYFPVNQQKHHLTALNPYLAFQETHGSLTSSVVSDTSDVDTSQQFENALVTSQQVQMINNADCYNFVYH